MEGEAENAGGGGGGDSSLERSYECNFCRRGFSNAQALGGHMNMHRRDRAKMVMKRGPPALPAGQWQQHGAANLMPRGEEGRVWLQVGREQNAAAEQLDLELRLWPESAGRN